MSNGEITRFIVTLKYQERSLADINELTNELTRGGFLLTMSDDEGKIHELGPNTFGMVSALSKEEVAEMARALGEVALDQKPEVEVTTWEAWQKAI
ncbi:type V toxin-antitoxin system endoribonuclease antitoxin GhoS [Franconibacter helveticus]|uniref:type V toxin-antitoxin system endoribonuclease antitoxin GhoS n=1 Tax=Franconibacter helveticus TaxID=357240 RepID=UPI000DA1C027|nr:type V toxin-antitoxin system endoribonuclease antitoxin GhoS [Franconibacter helveticus]MDU6925526.1 type V toxin-antitoxin system endoribonuclease antitoxin GhoS [Franconibacter helveticus]